MPHALVGVAQLMIGRDESEESWIHDQIGVSEETIAVMSTVVSIASIVFGLINKAVQHLVLEADDSEGRSLRLGTLRRERGDSVEEDLLPGPVQDLSDAIGGAE